MKDYKPYSNYTNEELQDLLRLHTKKLGMPRWVNELAELAFKDNWNPQTDFDGCSVVQDRTHPDIACFIHDWLYVCGYNIPFANKLFKELMLLSGYSKWLAWTRYIAVVIAGNIRFKWLNRKVGNYTMEEIKDIHNP